MKKHNDQNIKEVLKELMGQRQLGGKLRLTKIRSSWEELMGPTISGYTTNIGLRKHTVYISLNSAPLRQELNMSKEKIVGLLNEALGEEYVKEVVIK